MAMALPRRYAALAIAAGAALVLYLAHSSGYATSPYHPHGPSSSSHLATEAPPYTAALVYLLSVMPGPRPADEIFDSLALMQKYIPWRQQWPVLLLHAGGFADAETQAGFLSRTRTGAKTHGLDDAAAETLVQRLEFVETHHELPEGIPAAGAGDDPVWAQEWPAYHHMCAFYSYKIFSHPRIRDLTYYLRLDDDSSVLGPTCLDPFEYMHTSNKSYAFRHFSPDMGWVTEGLHPFVNNYARRHPAVDRQLAKNNWEWPGDRAWPGREEDFGRGANFPSYETNFDLVKVPRFRTPEMLEFFAELASEPKRFYWNRWGDAPLRLAAVHMFLDVATEVHQMCEIPYAHKDYIFEDCDCTPL
ncbi:glycosyltransferase family 15 protein [Mycena galericulata]|nr:glycosyltransferase family 15 protein [Mycena galericulata]